MSSPLAVSIIIGISENSLTCWQSSYPDNIGSIKSRSTMSYSFSLHLSTASCPSYAQSTSYPSCSKLNFSPFTINFSSSTTKAFIYYPFLISRNFITYFFKQRIPNSRNLLYVLNIGKITIFITVLYNRLCLSFTYAAKSGKFCYVCTVNINLS